MEIAAANKMQNTGGNGRERGRINNGQILASSSFHNVVQRVAKADEELIGKVLSEVCGKNRIFTIFA